MPNRPLEFGIQYSEKLRPLGATVKGRWKPVRRRRRTAIQHAHLEFADPFGVADRPSTDAILSPAIVGTCALACAAPSVDAQRLHGDAIEFPQDSGG
jgi:hypothetical protein